MTKTAIGAWARSGILVDRLRRVAAIVCGPDEPLETQLAMTDTIREAAAALETQAAENVRLAGERDEARKPKRDAMIERTEAEWDALQDALGTQPGWEVGRVLSEQDIADLRLIDRCHREDDEAATDAYHRGYEDGLRERGGDALVELNRRVDETWAKHGAEKAMRAFADQRAEKAEARALAAEQRLAEIEAGVTREKVIEIIDPAALDGFERALSGCIENGQPIHLAHHYAWTQFGEARDAAFAKADDLLALISRPAPTEEKG